MAVVFHEDEDEGERGGEGRRGRESMVAHDDEKDIEMDDEEGVEADYDEVLKTAVSISVLVGAPNYHGLCMFQDARYMYMLHVQVPSVG